MIKSLNISVSCAVSLYEACRQRSLKGMYEREIDLPTREHKDLFDEFQFRHKIHKEPKE